MDMSHGLVINVLRVYLTKKQVVLETKRLELSLLYYFKL